MAQTELIMPKMGESIMEATILKWLKKEGESVEMDEPLLEIATDKVDSEVPAPENGVISKILFAEGETVAVGKVIAIISDGSADNNGITQETKAEEVMEVSVEPIAVETVATAVGAVASKVVTEPIPRLSSNGDRFYSPLVRTIAKKENISLSELENIAGSGSKGRVTKKDIVQYISNKSSQVSVQVEEKAAPVQKVVEAPVKPVASSAAFNPSKYEGMNVEIVEMDRMRKLIADHMVHSKSTSAHVTSFVEADVTSMVLWRNKVKAAFKEREGENITFTPLFLEAVIKALKDYPKVNGMIDNYHHVIFRDLNIGMATALPSGNLIVPVIKSADQLNLTGLTKKVNDLAVRARTNKLTPTDIEGGTFTLTNVGTFGNVMGTPVISQPQTAILATGAIRKKPVVIETDLGDTIAIRHMMFLSLSYDHRIIDGFLGGSFLKRIAEHMEAFDITREI